MFLKGVVYKVHTQHVCLKSFYYHFIMKIREHTCGTYLETLASAGDKIILLYPLKYSSSAFQLFRLDVKSCNGML